MMGQRMINQEEKKKPREILHFKKRKKGRTRKCKTEKHAILMQKRNQGESL